MKQLLLLYFCLSTICSHGQSGIEFFTSGNIYTGITKEVSDNYYGYDYNIPALINVDFALLAPMSVFLDHDFMAGMEFKGGLIINNRWYASTGIRYDTRRFAVINSCPYCNTIGEENQDINSKAIEIPLSLQYRIISDLPISPFLHAESFLSFRKYSGNNYYYGYSNHKQQLAGIRLGLGLNYRLGEKVELNLTGTWGKTQTLEGLSFFKPKDNYGYRSNSQITDYQLSLGVVSRMGR